MTYHLSGASRGHLNAAGLHPERCRSPSVVSLPQQLPPQTQSQDYSLHERKHSVHAPDSSIVCMPPESSIVCMHQLKSISVSSIPDIAAIAGRGGKGNANSSPEDVDGGPGKDRSISE